MIFEHYINSQTTGDKNSSSQVLIQNNLGYQNIISLGNYFSYDYPVYSLEGASFNYYGIDYNSISYDISNGKTYTLFFEGDSIFSVSGHTGSTLLVHELYRIPYTAYTDYVSNFQTTNVDIDIYLNQPLLEISEQASAITIINSAYTYSFPTQYKDLGNFTQDVFSDKDQYLLDTVFAFEESNDLTLGDCYYLDTASNLPVRSFLEPSATTFYRSGTGPFTITGNTTLSGSVINGAFFTYFVPPKKPNLNVSGGNSGIAVQGLQSNLSPVFNFANVDDGDYYQLQVNYDTADTPYSGSEVFTYVINKQIGDPEFVRTYSTPLRGNDDFIYRIGNTKEIINIFGVKQNITTWSDTVAASIVATGDYQLSGHTWKNFVDYNYSGYYKISGMTIVSQSTVGTYNYYFSAATNGSMASNTISASTNQISTTTYEFNVDFNDGGLLTTTDWKNALYSSATWNSTGLYVVGDSINTGLTSSIFNFNTVSRGIENASITLYQIYNNTSLGLGIDVPSSNQRTTYSTQNYNNMQTGITYTRISSTEGFFNFGSVQGGYYRIVAQAPSPTYTPYKNIDLYITINSNTNIDLIFNIDWSSNFSFSQLSNELFL